MFHPLLSAAGIAEIHDGSVLGLFVIFGRLFVWGGTGAVVCAVTTLWVYRAQIRRLRLSFELMMSLPASVLLGFYVGAALLFVSGVFSPGGLWE